MRWQVYQGSNHLIFPSVATSNLKIVMGKGLIQLDFSQNNVVQT